MTLKCLFCLTNSNCCWGIRERAYLVIVGSINLCQEILYDIVIEVYIYYNASYTAIEEESYPQTGICIVFVCYSELKTDCVFNLTVDYTDIKRTLALLCTFPICYHSSQCCSSPLCPAVCHSSHVFDDAPIPLWFGRLFVMRSPAITSQPGESTQPCALINPAAVCVHCSAHSASRWVSTCWRHQRSSTQEM